MSNVTYKEGLESLNLIRNEEIIKSGNGKNIFILTSFHRVVKILYLQCLQWVDKGIRYDLSGKYMNAIH